MLNDPGQHHGLYNTRTSLIASHVELAVDSESRRRGLLGRDTFAAGSALIIAPCSSIHTFFMRFDIDVVFVARDGRVLKTCSTIPPWRIAFSMGAFAAIELPADTLARAETRTGDILTLAFQDG